MRLVVESESCTAGGPSSEMLEALQAGTLAWITMSGANEPVIRQWWAYNPDNDYRSGETGFQVAEDAHTEACFLILLDNVAEQRPVKPSGFGAYCARKEKLDRIGGRFVTSF